MRTPLLALAILTGCGWNHLPDQGNVSIDAPLWDAGGTVSTRGGVYVPLPYSGNLAWVTPDGAAALVPLRPSALARLVATPGGDAAIAFLETYTCTSDQRQGQVERPEDCDEDLVIDTRLAVVSGGEVALEFEVPGHFNAVSFSDDGAWAVAYLDLSLQVSIDGVISLTSVLAIDLASGEAWSVPVGFAANRVLFDSDSERAVVLSQSEVAVIDLGTSPPRREVTFPLTLDPDDVVDPVGVALTADGRYALITVQGSGDLYVLDLFAHAVNLVSLVSNPSAMAVDATTDQTVIAYAGTSRVEILEHQFFDTELIDLDEPMDRIANDSGLAVLWNHDNGHDVYRLDLTDLDLTEYRLQNPAMQLHLAPTREYAIALTRPEGGQSSGPAGYYDQSPGMEILDLRQGQDDTFPYLLEGQGIGAAFIAGEGTLQALVLQRDIDYVYVLDLYTQQPRTLELTAPPVGIGTVVDGPFYITHDVGLGLITFYDPEDDSIVEASGFAALGLFEGPEVLFPEDE